ncbi:YidC/Oxa1 family membrane protein insertase [bacterium]|nr:YidC/Oxa1 family membrane protein insertase [bacterium]
MFNTLITYPLYNALIFLFAFVRDMGVAIILLTIVVKLIFLRQSVKAEKSRLELQKLQPELNKIKDKYKDDKDKQAQAMMALYKEKNINPFGSCLPTLIQMPFLIGLFIVFRQGVESGLPLYDFVKNLLGTTPISSISLGFIDLTKIPNTGWLLIFPILATVLQYFQMKMMMSKNSSKDAASSQMNMMSYLMPGLTLWFTLSLPAGLSIYWISTTLFAIVQQIFIDKYEIKHHPELKPKN